MNLDLTETQGLLEETLASFLEARVSFDRVRQLEQAQEMDGELWAGHADQGFLALSSEGKQGGQASLIELGLLTEQLARKASPVPILEVAVAGLALEGAPEEAAKWSPLVAAGTVLPVPALLEEEDDFSRVDAQVDAEGRLTGTKAFVDYGQHATHHVVAAQGREGVGLYWVDAADPQVTCEPLVSIGRTPLCRVDYDGVQALRIAGAAVWADLIRLGRVLAAVQCVGSMQTALDMTVAYAKVREQFGQTIGSFQAVRHHCATMLSRLTSARIMAYEALSLLGQGKLDDRGAAAAKAAASRAAPEVLMLGHQIHGGNGVIEENDLYFFTLRGKERSLAWGSVEECLALMSLHVHETVDLM
ncbi:MAG: acyl-CoA dehydrogenase family protein [Myxococcota bacterium]|nr:acyl-CoA dehydrogenase family protein [Myxococcota bacterium]